MRCRAVVRNRAETHAKQVVPGIIRLRKWEATLLFYSKREGLRLLGYNSVVGRE